MASHSQEQQYSSVSLSGPREDTSYDPGRTAVGPEVIELDDIPLTSKDASAATLLRRGSSDSLVSVASSQDPQVTRNRARFSLQRAVKQFLGFLERSDTRVNGLLRNSSFYGWRMGVLFGSCMSAFVLCVNLGLAMYGTTTKNGYVGGIADLRTGPAKGISRWSTVFHLIINALSTMLLAASNYTMQVLSSPTREDIDKAHRRGQWFDIGILSFRNLRRIPRQRAALGLVLAFSSIPLHLFYNASIFQIATFHEYNIEVVQNATSKWAVMDADRVKYSKVGSSAWRSTYDTQYGADRGDLFLVVDYFGFNANATRTTVNFTEYFSVRPLNGSQHQIRALTNISDSPNWISLSEFGRTENATAWPEWAHVTHAFSQIKPTKSRLQLSLTYILVVIACNILKLGVMIWTLIIDCSTYIVTLGDGIASFLQRPDQITRSHCMLGKDEMLYKLGYMSYHHPDGDELETHSLRINGIWLPQRRPYFSLIGQGRQVFYVLLFCLLSSGCFLMPFMELARHGNRMLQAWGTASDDVLPFGAGPLLNALIVNLPQLILSFCYLALNGMCTSMAAGQEWNNLARTRKGLRVTKRLGEQRSTYFLQLPYRWALPLLVTSGFLHWLLSQSLFLVRVVVMDRNNEIQEQKSKTACGLSRLSLLILLVAALVLVSAVGAIGVRSVRESIPMAGSCSLVISAACHPPEGEDRDAYLKRVKWGVTTEADDEGYGHCSITAGKAKKIKVGDKYR